MSTGNEILSFLGAVAVALVVVRPVAAWLARLVGWIESRRDTPAADVRERMLRLQGVARSDLAPRGKVFVRGEIWAAETFHPVAAGEAVEVVDVEGLTLWVRPAETEDSGLRGR